MNQDYLWDPSAQPDPEIAQLEQLLRPLRFVPGEAPVRVARRGRVVRNASLAAAAVVFVAVGSGLVYWRLTTPAPWTMEIIQGSALLSGTPFSSGRALTAGATIETDSVSTARIAIGEIGVADLGPGSSLRLVRIDSAQHRLELREGTIYARIWAPPRFFVVETPSATATDLGCIYTMSVDSAGNGQLKVIEGEVELASRSRGVLVPAGNAVALLAGEGPGLPYPDGSSSHFRAAVAAADSAAYNFETTARILQLATPKETVTLWHLLSRADRSQRGAIFSRLALFAKPPEGVSQSGVETLDQSMLALWRHSMRDSWNSQRQSWWRRVLLRVGVTKPAVRIVTGR